MTQSKSFNTGMFLLLVAMCLALAGHTSGLVIHSIYPRVGSLAGGTTVNIYGSGFNTDTYNSVNLVFIGTVPCRVQSYTVNQNRLECITDPYPDAEESRSYSRLQSSVISDGQSYISTQGNDAFTYHWSYTPQIWKVSPSSGPVGTQVEVGGYRFTWNYNDYNHFFIGNSVCALRDSQTNRQLGIRSKWPLLYVTCLTSETLAGGWNATTVLNGARGRSWNHSQALYPVHDWNLAMYELYPDIHSVSPQVGSPSGGALVTITGTGFSGSSDSLEVDIDGVPCEVVSHTSTEIKCWSGAPEAGSVAIADQNMEYPITESGYRFRGSRGVRVHQYRSISGNSIDNLHSSNKYPDSPDYVFSYPSFSTGTDIYRHGNYGERLMAFFNPHSSGRHTFYISNDDQGGLWFAPGNNITEADSNRIITSERTTGFEYYERYFEQRSEVLNFEEDEDYLLVGEFKEGGGGDYLTVGALLHDEVDYNYKQTKQAVREEQRLTLSSAGLYDIQTLHLAVNRSTVKEDDPPYLVVEWGGRESEPISLLSLQGQPEILATTVLSLFSGVCEFDVVHGVNHYPGPNGFDFEGGIRSDEAWAAWNGSPPEITEEEALCGRHSLYVADSRGQAFTLDDDSGKKTSDFPFICLGYKLPQGHTMALAVNIKDYGWWSIPLSDIDTGPFTFQVVSSFFDNRYNPDDELMDDDSWHYTCTDLQIMLIDNLPLVEDGVNRRPRAPRFHHVLGMGLYTDPDPARRGFYVDEVSLLSEKRTLQLDSYQAPTRPNGRSLHNVLTSSSYYGNNDTTGFNVTINLELVPSTCINDLPLINVSPLHDDNGTNTTGVLLFQFERTQSASTYLSGNYTLGYNGQSTAGLQHDVAQEEIKEALESLEGVGEVTVSYSTSPLPQDVLGNFCPGRSFSVRFETTAGDLPLIEINYENLFGDDVMTSVIETKAGGLFLRPIPGHMLQTVETTPQVHVRIRGQLAACGGGNAPYDQVRAEDFDNYCGFVYAPTAMATVTSVNPTTGRRGDTIELHGDGFSETLTENYVKFGSVACDVTSSTRTQIDCTLGETYAGYKELYLHVISAGVANTSGVGLLYRLAIDSVDVSAGSQGGGTTIVISGSGFFPTSSESNTSSLLLAEEFARTLTSLPSNECSSGSENVVAIGDNACEIVEATLTTITCLTPEETGGATMYDITASVGCPDNSSSYMSAVLTGGYLYDVALTATVDSILPSDGVIHGGENVVIRGSGFADDATGTTVMLGGLECTISAASSTEVTCTTPAHTQGAADVNVIVLGKGRATGVVTFSYGVDVTSISHCSGSLLGGQVLDIDGSRFGTDRSQVEVHLGGRPCKLTSLSDTEILCVTSPTVQTHLIDNNLEHPEYGLGYQWNPSSLTVHPGDTVQWSWTGTSFAARRGVAQVNRPGDTEYNGVGFRSGRSITGSFSHTFTKPGTYYYIADGYGHIGFNGTITVADLEDYSAPLSITINSVPIDLSAFAITCEQTSSPFSVYTYSVASTPVLISTSPDHAAPGDMIEVTISGISNMSDDNTLIFGGKTPLSCTSLSPMLLSSTNTSPDTSMAATLRSYLDSTTTVQCTLSSDIVPGRYRTLLHVAGRGWASAVLDDTTLEVKPRIDSPPQVSASSLRGGLPFVISTTGLLPSSITNTRVVVGNTPCPVQSISPSGELMCTMQAAIDDGYSSVIGRDSPLAYWSLQADYYRSNGSYLEADGEVTYRSGGSLEYRADAIVFGEVEGRQEGISGNFFTNQAVFFEASYIAAPGLREFASPAGFSAEFWLKSDNLEESYRIIFSSSSYQDDISRGYIVLLNPCNQIEFWVATGLSLQSPIGGGITECDIVTNTSYCSQSCNGVVRIQESRNQNSLPSGVWHVTRDDHSDWSDWQHIYFGWEVEGDGIDVNSLYSNWADEDCSEDELCTGVQTLAVNSNFTTSNTTYLRSPNTQVEVGGTSALPVGDTNTIQGQLFPFVGYLDEVAFYGKSLTRAQIEGRVRYGTSEDQPIWLTTDGVDGIGTGAVPNIEYSEWDVGFSDELVLDWDILQDGSYVMDNSTAFRFEWIGLHGIREVSHSVYESCDLEAPYIEQWSANTRGGRRTVWLETGKTYYFIDSVVGGCLDGRKLSARVGNIEVIEWRVTTYADITIPEGTGLLFQWDGSVYHDLIEMQTAANSPADCNKGHPNQRERIGLVTNEWHSEPSTSGEISLTGLSLGPHHFLCSVSSHCVRGMRFTVNVVSRGGGESTNTDSQDSNAPVVHTIPWRIQDYDDFTMVEGETLKFAWEGFHSLHQISEDTYNSCDLSADPLFEWGLPSVDNSVSIQGLVPGEYFFLCAVAGHCDAGMKIKVIVLPDDGLPVLSNGIAALCADGVNCSIGYSVAATPQLAAVEPSATTGGSTLTLRGANLLPFNTTSGSPVNDITVWVDKAPCSNVVAASNDTVPEHVITCDITDYEFDYYHVDVFVAGKGYASVTPAQLVPGPLRNSTFSANYQSPYPKVFLTATATSISPTSGSVQGGTVVTIDGSGFSHISDRNSVTLGSVTCRILETSSSQILCMTGSAGESTAALSATVNGFPVSTSLVFEYTSSSTPQITSLSSPSDINSLSGGDTIQFSGTQLGASASDVRVLVVSDVFIDFNMANECVVDSFSADPSGEVSIACTAPNKPAGTYDLLVHVQGLGFASAVDSSVGYALVIDTFTPDEGGYGGGISLTIDGSGFAELSSDSDSELFEQISITLCQGQSASTMCTVGASSLTQVTCVLDQTDTPSPFDTDTSCTVTVEFGGLTQTSPDSFQFLGSLTPRLHTISPAIGGTGGGTTVTLQGDGFVTSPPGDVVVTIDGTTCEASESNDTTFVCLTGNHSTTLEAEVKVYVPGKGNAIPSGDPVMYEYVDLWSSRFTWGGGPLPVEGDSVYIKSGQTVFLDISPPILNLVLIEGSLIFQDEQDLHLQAKYIFINTGKLQVGTEDSPFTHSATITLHGSITDPEIPIYGAKVLGIRQGELDLHGRPRQVTWTRLAETASGNASSITLQESVDWVPGDRIVIAPTGKDGNETEDNEVLSVSSDGRTLSLVNPLRYTHHGVTDTYEGGHSIEIRAEVGLLSHNVIVEGALPTSSEEGGAVTDQYGSQIFVHRTGPHPTPIRIEHTEIRYGGQAFRLGRYAVHFHLSGSMNGSYVRHCAIHHSNNRAITAHGVHDLLIEGNVAYDIKGHTYFVEDGIETNNRYINNLGVLTRGSSSLLNTDQIPATFWITNPQNTFIGNAAAASRAYGFWFDFDAFPSGASRTTRVCPNKEPFGVFRGNTAHTCNEFGLRIWETYVPFADGCAATEHQVATLYDFTTYANGINGVELSIVGHVRLIGFKVADNVLNGIQIIETLGEWGGPTIENSLIVSHSSVNTGEPQTGGIKTPNTPRLTVSNVTFANFDLPTTSCLKACSHCKPRQGGFQVWFEQLSFIGGSSNHKASFQWEYEVLYKDLDGTLTGQPGGGWVLPDSDLVPPQYCVKSQPEFSLNHTVINGTVCNMDINFLRMAWNRAEPLETLEGVRVNVSNQFGASEIPWRHYRLTHLDGYMFTMPDGYDHRLVWDLPQEHRVDQTSYNAGVYGIRPGTRHWVTHEFVQTPDHINLGDNFEPTEHGGVPIDIDRTFSWHIENDTDPDIVTYFISGHNLTDQNNNATFHYSYEPCPRDGCPPPAIDYGNYESVQRRWSDPNSWPSNQVPLEGEDVTISSRWRMLLDVTPPTLGKVFILGELIFEDERDYNFTADVILIQGEMARVFIGTEEEPFIHNVVITLNGRREDDPLVLSRRLNFGSKGIGVFGNLSIHGMPKATWTHLGSSVLAGSDTLQLQGNDYPDWGVGDEIVIAPSGYDPNESEIRTVTDYDRSNGVVNLNEPLLFDHLVQPFLEPTDLDSADPPLGGGADPWWGDGGTIAPEVGLLSHNIIIQGGEDPDQPLEEHHYGCRILVGEYITGSYIFHGRLNIDSVEIRYCGQGGYFSPRDPRYAIAFASSFETSEGSYIRRSSIHHGYNTAIGIHTSYGIQISNNVIWRTVDSGLKVGGRDNTVTDNLAMLTSTIQPNNPPDRHSVDFPATFDIDGSNIVRGNAAAGSTRIAFRYSGEPCLEGNTAPTYEEAMFWDNTAHSGFIGLVVLGLPNDCTAIGGLTTAYQWNYGVFSSTASSLVTTHLKIGIGKVGLNLNVFGPNPVAHLLGKKSISISDSLLVGSLPGESCDTTRPTFVPRGSVSFSASDNKLGIMMSSFNQRRSKMDGTGAWHLMKGYPVIDGVVNTNGVSFARFLDTSCNYRISAIGNNPLSPDAVHPVHMTGTNKLNVELNSLVFFYEPDLEWITQEDCVDMDCDGPKHALIRDTDGRFVNTYPTQGSVIPFAELRFANYSHRLPVTWLAQDRENGEIAEPSDVLQYMGIARGEPGNLTSSAGGCEWIGAWQGYRCKALKHHMLVIESLDEDTETRRLSPLALDGGDTGAGHYTDLINGPMDHGWCVYYTCLKRLSTFFTVVAVGTDYCIWMTGSSPTTIRFHLLNAGPDDVISMCIFFKDTKRKDVYKNNVFIEPENVRYLEGGGIQQTDGSFKPSKDRFGGANYFERETQFMHLIIKGGDPIEIRTPPVVQVSLSLAVSLDDFFNVGDLIRNLAFVLKIDPSKIRVVKIIAENSARRRRSLLATTGFNHTTITLEFGDPPAPNITAPPPPTVAQEIMMAGETNDSVDLEDHTAVDNPLNGTNPLNVDPPDSVESFAENFNASALEYIDEVEIYEEILAEVEEVNALGGQVVDLVLTGDIANLTNATVIGLSVVPATPPPSPLPPVVPPVYENATTDDGDPVIIAIDDIIIELPTIVAETTEGSGAGDDSVDVEINFVLPTEMRVTMEPQEVTGHLVHVSVTVFDDSGEPVVNLGLVNPWMCEAVLLHDLGKKIGSVSELRGVTRVPFVQGVAEFTRLRVDRPGDELNLEFRTIPSRFHATTSVSFQVVTPYDNTTKEKIGFMLAGDSSSLPSNPDELRMAVVEGLSLELDVDISRIENLTVEITRTGLSVTFDLLDRHPTDPPDVLPLYDTIALLMHKMDSNTLVITINNTPFNAVPGSFQYVTPPSPTTPTIISQYLNVFIAVGAALGCLLLLIVIVVLFYVCTRSNKRKGKGGKKGKDEGRIPLHAVGRVSPMPQGDDGESMSGESELQLDHSMFVRQPSRLRNSPLHVPYDEDSIGGKTDETSLGMSDSSRGVASLSGDCWADNSRSGPSQRPPSSGPRRFSPPSREDTPTTLAGIANKSTSWAVSPSGNMQGYKPVNTFVLSNDKRGEPKRLPGNRVPMSPGWY